MEYTNAVFGIYTAALLTSHTPRDHNSAFSLASSREERRAGSAAVCNWLRNVWSVRIGLFKHVTL